ncbi:hypothetical protein SAMN04490357_0571 [Streptomyces misionensis]|uniref:Uncharacterized protein n=1 Tax=Streptomyces misionensis TaxID=67331 RepID=A0A1H4MSX6_9ACTN|nr:hypothetical protein [Streptomyces misionensis]SEB85894.1 hypothetical protein SAMN04490357_0571 [Streptomyces misionensis]
MRALLAERQCLVVLDNARDEGQQSSWPGLVPLDTTEQARAWLESEASAWLATLRGAAARGEHARVAATAEAMEGFANVCAFSGYWTEVYHLSSEAAAALDDPRLRAAQLSMYCWALANEYRAEEAVARADEALEHARRAGDVSQQARAMYYASWPCGQLGRDEQRMEKLRAAADLFEAAGDHEGWTFSMLSYRTSRASSAAPRSPWPCTSVSSPSWTRPTAG